MEEAGFGVGVTGVIERVTAPVTVPIPIPIPVPTRLDLETVSPEVGWLGSRDRECERSGELDLFGDLERERFRPYALAIAVVTVESAALDFRSRRSKSSSSCTVLTAFRNSSAETASAVCDGVDKAALPEAVAEGFIGLLDFLCPARGLLPVPVAEPDMSASRPGPLTFEATLTFFEGNCGARCLGMSSMRPSGARRTIGGSGAGTLLPAAVDSFPSCTRPAQM